MNKVKEGFSQPQFHKCLHVFIQPLRRNRMQHNVNFFSSFPSPRPVAIPKIKSPVCPTIYPWLEGEYLSQEYWALCEMQRVWTRDVTFNSYDDIHYTTSASWTNFYIVPKIKKILDCSVARRIFCRVPIHHSLILALVYAWYTNTE